MAKIKIQGFNKNGKIVKTENVEKENIEGRKAAVRSVAGKRGVIRVHEDGKIVWTAVSKNK